MYLIRLVVYHQLFQYVVGLFLLPCVMWEILVEYRYSFIILLQVQSWSRMYC